MLLVQGVPISGGVPSRVSLCRSACDVSGLRRVEGTEHYRTLQLGAVSVSQDRGLESAEQNLEEDEVLIFK